MARCWGKLLGVWLGALLLTDLPAIPSVGYAYAVPYLPNPSLTPGGILTTDLNTICHAGYSATVRDVSDATKSAIYAAYGITPSAGSYEVDHLIPLSSGGSNSTLNLWIQPYHYNVGGLDAGSVSKDYLENVILDLGCSGQVPLATLQQALASNWITAYQTYIGNLPLYPYCPPQGLYDDPICKGQPLHLIATYQGQYIYADKFKTVYLVSSNGTTDAKKPLTVKLQSINLTQVRSSDRCGIVHFRIDVTSPNVIINGAAVNLSTATNTSKSWGCSSTGNIYPQVSSAFVPSTANQILKTSANDYYWFGLPSQKYLVAYQGNATKTLHFDRCGVARLRFNATTHYQNTTTINAPNIGSIVASNLLTTPGKLLCAGNGILIYPGFWSW